MATGCLQDEIIPLEHALEKAMAYNITFGNVIATSGANTLLPHSKGHSDWAIISITNKDVTAENKVCSLYTLSNAFSAANTIILACLFI